MSIASWGFADLFSKTAEVVNNGKNISFLLEDEKAQLKIRYTLGTGLSVSGILPLVRAGVMEKQEMFSFLLFDFIRIARAERDANVGEPLPFCLLYCFP